MILGPLYVFWFYTRITGRFRVQFRTHGKDPDAIARTAVRVARTMVAPGCWAAVKDHFAISGDILR